MTLLRALIKTPSTFKKTLASRWIAATKAPPQQQPFLLHPTTPSSYALLRHFSNSTPIEPSNQHPKRKKITLANAGILITAALLASFSCYLYQKLISAKGGTLDERERALVDSVLATIEEECRDLLPNQFFKSTMWATFKTQGYVAALDSDEAHRAAFVGLQAAIEKSLLILHLRQKLIFKHEIIHTQFPPTPLREKMIFDPMLNNIDPRIANDPMRFKTISSRARIIAEILQNGIDFTAIFNDTTGLTIAAKKVFEENVVTYPHLKMLPLEEEITADIHGATAFAEAYASSSATRAKIVFIIEAPQAGKAIEQAQWGIGLFPENTKVDKLQEKLMRRLFFFSKSLTLQPERPKPGQQPGCYFPRR